jgi:hypothetical protein
MEIVRKHDLIGDWSNVKVYVYGLGHIADKSVYVTPQLLTKLQSFWEMYFTTGGGNVLDIGLPTLLRTSLRDDR